MNYDAINVIQPGDHLLYGPGHSVINHIICVKTWSPVSHIEIYVGGGESVASRNGIGVGQYPFRYDQLFCVLRPTIMLSLPNAMHWFKEKAAGQAYDFAGLMCFFLAAKRGSRDRMFCSEFATRWDRFSGIRSFASHWDADKVAPGNFLMSPAFEIVWKAKP